VDDDEIDIYAMKKCLRPLLCHPKMEFVFCESGEIFINELLRLSKEQDDSGQPHPFLVFLDIHMPRMNGFDVLEFIRTKPWLKNTVVFMTSSSENPKLVARAYDYHVAGYLAKNRWGDNYCHFKDLIQSYTRLVTQPHCTPLSVEDAQDALRIKTTLKFSEMDS
jgi:CheY-like chemotaxis protein